MQDVLAPIQELRRSATLNNCSIINTALVCLNMTFQTIFTIKKHTNSGSGFFFLHSEVNFKPMWPSAPFTLVYKKVQMYPYFYVALHRL